MDPAQVSDRSKHLTGESFVAQGQLPLRIFERVVVLLFNFSHTDFMFLWLLPCDKNVATIADRKVLFDD